MGTREPFSRHILLTLTCLATRAVTFSVTPMVSGAANTAAVDIEAAGAFLTRSVFHPGFRLLEDNEGVDCCRRGVCTSMLISNSVCAAIACCLWGSSHVFIASQFPLLYIVQNYIKHQVHSTANLSPPVCQLAVKLCTWVIIYWAWWTWSSAVGLSVARSSTKVRTMFLNRRRQNLVAAWEGQTTSWSES